VARHRGALTCTPAGLQATLVTLKEHIELIKQWGVGQTPELKSGDPARIQAIFGGQAQYAQKMIDTYKAAGVDPKQVWAQSFDLNDILYWIRNEPAFGRQAVYLDSIDPTANPPIPRQTNAQLTALKTARRADHRAADSGAIGREHSRPVDALAVRASTSTLQG